MTIQEKIQKLALNLFGVKKSQGWFGFYNRIDVEYEYEVDINFLGVEGGKDIYFVKVYEKEDVRYHAHHLSKGDRFAVIIVFHDTTIDELTGKVIYGPKYKQRDDCYSFGEIIGIKLVNHRVQFFDCNNSSCGEKEIALEKI